MTFTFRLANGERATTEGRNAVQAASAYSLRTGREVVAWIRTPPAPRRFIGEETQ